MKKLLTFFLVALLAFGVGWAETVTLSNANIVAAGSAENSYQNWTITDGNNNTWLAYAIKKQHSNATSGYHYLQIKKYASNTAYYIQVPELGTKITQIVMTVSSSSQPMTGGGNTATLYFSSSNSTSETGTGVASGTGASSVTIDCSSLNLNTGYITASAGIRIWDITVTYDAGSTPPAPEKWYRKVTSANDLVVDKKYIFMKENGQSSVGMGAITSSYGTPVTGLAISDNRVNIGGTGVVEFTLGGSSDAWTFKNPDNRYLGVVSETGDGFATSATLGGYTDLRWTVTSTGTVRNNKYTSKYIRCNSANSFGLYSSGTNAYLYVEDLEDCEAPTFSPDGGIFTGSVNVTITSDTEGATIYYTTDGTDPVVGGSSITNGGTVELTESCTLKAMAVKSGMDNSPISTSQSYTINPGSVSDSKIYRKVTSTSDLKAGKKYIIVYEDGNSSVGMGAFETTTSPKHFTAASGLSVSNGQVDISGKNVLELTLGGTEGAWVLFTGNGYIQGADAVQFNIVSDVSADNSKWVITNSVANTSINGFVVKNAQYDRYIKHFRGTGGDSFRHYNTANGSWAYLYVQNTEPTLFADPNPLNINDTNETNGRIGTFTLSGLNLGTDNVGVNVLPGSGNFERWTSDQSWGFNNQGGTVNGTVYVKYNGYALSATGQVQPANNIVNTIVDVNYLYTGPIYVAGDVNDTHWNTNEGAQLTRDDNGLYSGIITVQQSDGTAGYITFTKQLGSNFNDGRFGPISSGNWWLDGHEGVYVPIDTLGNKNNIRLLPGVYTVNVNPATNQFMITPYVITVTISPEDGTHFTGSTISGTITDSPAGTIEWSTDGTNWQSYTDGFTATVDQVGGSVTIYARSTSNGVTSDVVSATYTRDLAPAPEAPSFSMGSSAVTAGTVITITAPEGCTLYVDGQQVNSPYDVVINHGTTITAYCVNDEGTSSATVTNTYTIATVCNAVVEFKNLDDDETAATTWDKIGGEDDNNYFEAGKSYIGSAENILRVYKGKTGLKFGNSSNGGTITFILDGDTEWKVSHITLNAKNYNGNEVTFTVTTDNDQSNTTSNISSNLGGYTLDFNSSAITSITISSSARAYLQGFTITYDCAPEIETASLAEIESTSGLDHKVVKVSDELIGAWAVVNPQTGAKLLWAKDQGNASIEKLPGKTAGQRDYVKDILKYKRILDDEVQPTWDESNWVVLDFSDINDVDPFEFVGHKITENTVIGEYYEYSDGMNYVIKITEKPAQLNGNALEMDVDEYPGYDGPFPENKLGDKYDLAYNTYVPANFMTENHNHEVDGKVVGFVADNGALPSCQGDSLYFVNPKIQEVAHIWAVWNGGEDDIFTVYETEHRENENINAWHLNGTFRVNWTYNCTGVDPNENTALVYGRPTDLVPNMAYEFHAVVMRPANGTRLTVAPQGTAEPGTPSTSYMVYPLDMSNDGTPTAVLELSALKTVASVTYYNLMGVESKKPFDGVNIVVTRYSDGSISTQKVLR